MKLKARSSRNFFECDVNEFSVCFLYLFLFFLREETTTSFRLLFEYRCAYIGRSTNSTTSLYRDIFYFFEKLCVDTSNQTSFRFYEAKAIGKTTAGPPVVLFFRRRSFFFSLSYHAQKNPQLVFWSLRHLTVNQHAHKRGTRNNFLIRLFWPTASLHVWHGKLRTGNIPNISAHKSWQ